MGKIIVETCHIEGLKVITPTVYGDKRGYFMETYNYNDFKEAGIDLDFVQDNQSASRKGVLRGLHFQKEHPQAKLVRVLSGEVFDVAVDLRPGSDTYGKWIIDRENDGTLEHPKHMPFVYYSSVVDRFIYTLYDYCEKHPEFQHTRYAETLKEYGLEWGSRMKDADVSDMDAKGVIALLIGIVRAERFGDGILLEYLQSGCILRWLERLEEIDNAEN